MAGVTHRADFAGRLRGGARLSGTFQKTPSHQITELLGDSGLDFAVLDTEHAPFDPAQIDLCMLAAKATNLPMLVRVARNEPDAILAVLDMGATGTFIPHVRTPQDAVRAVSASRYRGGTRGFSPSTRAGAYGAIDIDEYVTAADAQTVVIGQIEDADALDWLNDIGAVEGLSGLFLGRADLAMSLNCGWNDAVLDEAAIRMADAARAAGIAAGAYLANEKRLPEFLEWGYSFFVFASDQVSVRAGAADSAAALAALRGQQP